MKTVVACFAMLVTVACSDADLNQRNLNAVKDNPQFGSQTMPDASLIAMHPIYGLYHELPGVGNDGDGSGVAFGDINGNGILDMVLMAVDIGSPADQFRYYVG